MGLLFAMQPIWIRGWRKVWFEGDCIELDRVVNQVVIHHAKLGNILHDIRHWMSLLSDCSLGSVNRRNKHGGRCIFKICLDDQADVIVFSVPHVWLLNFLYWAIYGLNINEMLF